VFEKDTDAYGRERDEVVMSLAKEAGVKVLIETGRTLWDSDELVKSNGNRPTMSISQVQNAGPKIVSDFALRASLEPEFWLLKSRMRILQVRSILRL